jgi:Right handed beta helix region
MDNALTGKASAHYVRPSKKSVGFPSQESSLCLPEPTISPWLTLLTAHCSSSWRSMPACRSGGLGRIAPSSTVITNRGFSTWGNKSQTGYEPVVTIERVTIRNGQAPYSTSPGGGILIYKGTLSLLDCVVVGCASTIYGAGISNAGSLQIERCTIRDNKITGLTTGGGRTAVGGGIDNSGSMTITNSTISGNRVFAGGGGIRNRGTAYISFSTITKK